MHVYDCYFTAYLGFSRNESVFAEEDGIGIVIIKGTPGLTAYVIGGKYRILQTLKNNTR